MVPCGCSAALDRDGAWTRTGRLATYVVVTDNNQGARVLEIGAQAAPAVGRPCVVTDKFAIRPRGSPNAADRLENRLQVLCIRLLTSRRGMLESVVLSTLGRRPRRAALIAGLATATACLAIALCANARSPLILGAWPELVPPRMASALASVLLVLVIVVSLPSDARRTLRAAPAALGRDKSESVRDLEGLDIHCWLRHEGSGEVAVEGDSLGLGLFLSYVDAYLQAAPKSVGDPRWWAVQQLLPTLGLTAALDDGTGELLAIGNADAKLEKFIAHVRSVGRPTTIVLPIDNWGAGLSHQRASSRIRLFGSYHLGWREVTLADPQMRLLYCKNLDALARRLVGWSWRWVALQVSAALLALFTFAAVANPRSPSFTFRQGPSCPVARVDSRFLRLEMVPRTTAACQISVQEPGAAGPFTVRCNSDLDGTLRLGRADEATRRVTRTTTGREALLYLELPSDGADAGFVVSCSVTNRSGLRHTEVLFVRPSTPGDLP